MRIGIVLPNVPAYSEIFFRNKIKGLQESGHEVMLFVGGKKPETKETLCPVFYAPDYGTSMSMALISSISGIFKVIFSNPIRSFAFFSSERKSGRKWIDGFKNTLANQHILSKELDFLHFGFGTVAIGREHLAGAMGAKMAVSFRGFDIGIYPLKYPGCYQLLFETADKIHVISDDLEQLLYTNGLNPQKANVVKITPAIDSSFFTPVARKQNETVEFVTLARLNWKKGLETTLEALALLKKTGVAFHYTIIGDGPEKERLLFAAHQLGITEHVTFAGKKSHLQVKELLEKASLYIQYSIQEGFCNAVLEAQATGLLCVVSDAEGLQENVLNNETGFVVAKQKPDLLFEKIKEVIGLPEEVKKNIKERAVLRVQKEFNLEKQKQEFIAFYTH